VPVRDHESGREAEARPFEGQMGVEGAADLSTKTSGRRESCGVWSGQWSNSRERVGRKSGTRKG
jgi:hypothetical protein